PIGSNNIFLTTALPGISVPVLLDGSTSEFVQCASGTDGIPLQLVSIVGNLGISDGLRLESGSDGSTIRALEIYKFDDDGIQINSNNNTVTCSIIGRSNNPNQDDGINIVGDGNRIGGGGAQARNVIVGNLGHGIYVQAGTGNSADNNKIRGNFIGRSAQTNSAGGIKLGSNSSFTTIGGTTAGERNDIIGNSGIGIEADSTNDVTIIGNYIGLAPDGTTIVANTGSGILVINSNDVAIGGLADGEGNFISGNGNHGINIDNSIRVVVNENTLGSDIAAGSAGNGLNGVYLHNGAHDNQIAYNRIRNNTRDGVRVINSGTVNNPIRYNSISDNGEQGIDLGANGITPNDGAGDPDTGPNNLQNFPDIDSVSGTTDLTFTGFMTGNLGDIMRIDIFHSSSCDGTHGEGKRYLGTYEFTMTAGTNMFGSTLSNVNVSGGEITMTATGPGSNTSEFSECMSLTVPTAVGLNGQMTVTPLSASGQTVGRSSWLWLVVLIGLTLVLWSRSKSSQRRY
ncbi:MAG TPA: right-handed parallel beta-helix repeat-containing protein, partial [Anaerolineae bacterium]|nr:right-handed parallel beta-helix repeat-containing protein [Anaerolineae bacterium]